MQAIRKYIVPDLHTYCTDKLNYVRDVGYGEGTFVGNVVINLPEEYRATPLELLVDNQLGLIPKLSIKRLALSDNRFNIVMPGDKQVFEGGVMEMITESVRKGTVTFRVPGTAGFLSVETDIRVPQGLPLSVQDVIWRLLS